MMLFLVLFVIYCIVSCDDRTDVPASEICSIVIFFIFIFVFIFTIIIIYIFLHFPANNAAKIF